MYNTNTGEFETSTTEAASGFGSEWELALEDIYADGEMLRRTPFAQIRRNAGTFA